MGKNASAPSGTRSRRRKVTGIVPVFNEEENIRACLESISWVDELIVVDSFSTDRTVEIAREYTDKVYRHEYKYSTAQKNWIIPQASHEWIFLLDADERCTPELRAEIEALLDAEEDPPHGAYWIYRRNFFLGKEIKHCRWNKDKVIRLFLRDRYRYEDVEVHGEIQPQDDVGVLRGRIEHYSYRTLDDYFTKLLRYTPWGAEKALKQGTRGRVFHILFRPAWEFFRRYVLYLGFLDGVHGLILSLTSAASVMFRFIKLWELDRTRP